MTRRARRVLLGAVVLLCAILAVARAVLGVLCRDRRPWSPDGDEPNPLQPLFPDVRLPPAWIARHVCDVARRLVGVLSKHGVRYWAMAGTALGAVRHGGAIPWDDDVDLAIDERDVAAFERAMRASAAGAGLRWKRDCWPLMRMWDVNDAAYMEHWPRVDVFAMRKQTRADGGDATWAYAGPYVRWRNPKETIAGSGDRVATRDVPFAGVGTLAVPATTDDYLDRASAGWRTTARVNEFHGTGLGERLRQRRAGPVEFRLRPEQRVCINYVK